MEMGGVEPLRGVGVGAGIRVWSQVAYNVGR